MAFVIWLLALVSAGTGTTNSRGSLSPYCTSHADCQQRLPRLDRSRCDPAGKRVVTVDVNGDGRPDVWKYYANIDGKEVLTCTQNDLNFDGQVDTSKHVGPKGQLLFDESDFDFDGKSDRISIYEGSTRHAHTVGPGTSCVNRHCTVSSK
jgi:hypothetical protein